MRLRARAIFALLFAVLLIGLATADGDYSSILPILPLGAMFAVAVAVTYLFIVSNHSRADKVHAALYDCGERSKDANTHASLNACTSNATCFVPATPFVPTLALDIDQLIRRVRDIDWFQFEKLVAVIYEHHGYSVERRGGANPDGGIDLVVRRASDIVAVQCKHWKAWKISVRTVRELVGAMADANLTQGALVTLAGYTGEAKQLADRHGIKIINEATLRKMLEEMNAATNPGVLSILNDTRKFCPKCESPMVMRTAKKGIYAGSSFWGCSAYPRCRYMMQVTAKAA